MKAGTVIRNVIKNGTVILYTTKYEVTQGIVIRVVKRQRYCRVLWDTGYYQRLNIDINKSYITVVEP